ncbi:MAG: glutamate-1-semialdehyde 2,1-aminomutase [Candidatus Binatia bacterium]|nr:glutamate-1-semialdehyde 2,1-aminomutase [Candidatus Binatia bacterium]
MSASLSAQLFARAQQTIPGGVNSPVRAWRVLGGEPLFIQRGKGCFVWDVEGRSYIDYVGSWGPLILGHAAPEVLRAIHDVMRDGTTFGAPTVREVEFAEQLCAAVPSLDMVRLTSSGTEATMALIRLARAFTGRDRIIKFDGCYHGHVDALLVSAGSGAATLSVPNSAGVPSRVAETTLVATFNDLASVEACFARFPGEIAAAIVEPVVGNMGVIPPAEGFLAGLIECCHRNGALVIFDEVMTGFRVAWGGAQVLYGLRPDLSSFGKVVGGGLPLAAFGGRREIMELLAPLGPVYHAGTLSGNPLAVAAGLRTLAALQRPGSYERLEELGQRLEDGLRGALTTAGIPGCVQRVGSMWTLFLGVERVTNAEEARAVDQELFRRWFFGMLHEGIYLPPSPFEVAFLSLAHTEAEVDVTVQAARRVLQRVERG